MKYKSILLFTITLINISSAYAWESHPAIPDRDENGDLRFNSEHVRLTSKALIDSSSFDFLPPSERLDPAIKICRKVKDFNSASLKWKTLTVREFCPANFAELPDFFHNMEDYINQGNACPPLADWDVKECHSFEHFMGALNSSHFPPQTKGNYQRYHDIALAITKHSDDLHDKLFLADALTPYRDYWEECRMEALTYESIGQHYLEDQWAMGHMWYRWGGPDVDDFPLDGYFSVLNGYPLAKLAHGTAVGSVSGLIHGWKSTVAPLTNITNITDDALSFNRPGVQWVRSDYPGGLFDGMGDLFIDQQGNFDQQKMEMYGCTEEGFRQLRSFQTNPPSHINELCWKNFATNEAMNIGLNYSPSTFASLAVVSGAKKIGIDGIGRDMSRLALIYAWAAFWHPYDTYLAEGYTTPARTKRITLFGIKPNDEYKEVSTYIDPARSAPGDPADTSGIIPDNALFGIRQVKYFNKCHANLYCEDTRIVNRHRDACNSDSNEYREVDCQICEELASRYYLGSPPLCQILAPGITPEPDNLTPPTTPVEVSSWCRSKETGEVNCPVSYDSSLDDNNDFTFNILNSNSDGIFDDYIICSYWDTGIRQHQTPFVNMKLNGVQKVYYESGNLRTTTTWVNGVQNGFVREYFESGSLQTETPWVNNKREGIQNRFYESGELWSETNYVDGNRDGDHKVYYQSGQLASITHYLDGNKDGEQRSYSETGELTFCNIWSNGTLIGSCPP